MWAKWNCSKMFYCGGNVRGNFIFATVYLTSHHPSKVFSTTFNITPTSNESSSSALALKLCTDWYTSSAEDENKHECLQ